MDAIWDTLLRSHLALIANLGLLTILAWVVTIFGQRLFSERAVPGTQYQLLVGVLFGATAAILMNTPIELEPGIFGDARGAPMLLAGVVGGPLSAVAAGLIAASTRLFLGGAGATLGATYVIVFAAGGLVWPLLARRWSINTLDVVWLSCLASVVTVLTCPVVLLLPPEKQYPVLIGLWPAMWVGNVVGVAILGSLIQREKRRREAEEAVVLQKALAEQAAEAKAKFLAAMSHEIRTPLNGILGILQLAQAENLPPALRQQLKTALESGNFLISLINQVLDFARIDAGKAVLTSQHFYVETLADSLHSMFRQQAMLKGLALNVDMTGETAQPVFGDYEHVRQILFNLIGNALKFTSDGRIDFRGSVQPTEAGYDLVFAVSDTGPGISRQDLDTIFEEFGQSDAGKTFGGTGLGLSISWKLARALGGSLTVSSEVGLGSTFTLRVPVAAGDARAIVRDSQDPAGTPQVPCRVLVAEDNSVNQMVVRGMLEQMGHRVTIVGNGREAIESWRRQTGAFDVILMDIEMPDMDGLQAAAAIRAAETETGFQRIPIVALTANAFDSQRQAYLAAGMDDVLTKPLRIGELRHVLSAVEPADPAVSGGLEHSASAATDRTETDAALVNDDTIDSLVAVLSEDRLVALAEAAEPYFRETIASMVKGGSSDRDLAVLAHQLRGMSANLAMDRLAAAAASIEAAGSPDRQEKIVRTLDALLDLSVTQLGAKFRARGLDRVAEALTGWSVDVPGAANQKG